MAVVGPMREKTFGSIDEGGARVRVIRGLRRGSEKSCPMASRTWTGSKAVVRGEEEGRTRVPLEVNLTRGTEEEELREEAWSSVNSVTKRLGGDPG